MKIDDVLLLRIASHLRQHITERLLITSHAQQHGMFSAVRPRAKCTKGTDWRTHNTAEIHGLVNQLRFLGRVHSRDRLFELQVGLCVWTHNPDVKWFLRLLCRYCRGPTQQQHECK